MLVVVCSIINPALQFTLLLNAFGYPEVVDFPMCLLNSLELCFGFSVYAFEATKVKAHDSNRIGFWMCILILHPRRASREA